MSLCRSSVYLSRHDFYFNDTATTEIYTLSLHDALPIPPGAAATGPVGLDRVDDLAAARRDRKSTRLNSSHANISYAVFCLKKKPTRRGLTGDIGEGAEVRRQTRKHRRL